MIKKIAKWLGLLLVFVVVILGGAKVYMDATYFSGYDPDAPLEVELAEVAERPQYMREKIYFNGFRGGRVPALLMRPKDQEGPYPCVIFLHGIGQKKEFVDEDFGGKTVAEFFTKEGFAFATFDQLMQGERKLQDKSAWATVNAFRTRPAYTVGDARRMIDYLETRSDIDADRIYLSGASYGAITGATAAAFDPRVRAVVLTYGGGNIPEMLKARMVAGEINRHGPYMLPAQILVWYLMSAADPLHYIGDIAPRPVLIQNGTDDCLIAAASARAFQEAAREPKTVTIYEGDHIGMDKDTVIAVLNETLEFFKKYDAHAASPKPNTANAA